MQRQASSKYPVLLGLHGYRYCQIFLARGDWKNCKTRGYTILTDAKRHREVLPPALGALILARSLSGSAIEQATIGSSGRRAQDEARSADTHFADAVQKLRTASTIRYAPVGFLSRASFRRSVGDWHGAARDLDEVEEIAEPGPMRLYLCDTALERARLAFAQIEAFAPLNGMLEKDNPPKPEVPSSERLAELKAEAEKQIKTADDYIQKCGYHRRDEELAELQAVLRGEKTFASLPPRV